jgi:serine/threonine protein kinase
MTELGRFIIDFSKYEQGRLLGEGNFGRVFLGVELSTGREVAIKHIKVPLSPDVSDQRSFIRELEILAENEHPGTLRLIGFRFSSDPGLGPTIVTEIMPHGSLSKHLEDEFRGAGTGLDATGKSICVFGIACAMAYCHSKGIIHRDLKPENVFLNADYEPVVADFGISRYCSGGLAKTGSLGTPLFMAPELFMAEDYSFGVDVYAFAMTLYSMFTPPKEMDDKRPPSRTPQQLMARIGKGTRWAKKPEIPDYYWAVIVKCWDIGPENRPQFKDIVEEFVTTHDYLLPGADREKVLAYEKKVYRAFSPPKVFAAGEPVLKKEKVDDITRKIERLLNAPLPTQAQLKGSLGGTFIQAPRRE